MVQEREANKGGLIAPGLFRGLVSAASTSASRFGNSTSSSRVSVVPNCIGSLEKPGKRQHLIPPQVLVPSSMKSSSNSSFLSAEKAGGGMDGQGMGGVSSNGGSKSFDFMVPEGRVHGGGLMPLFGGNLKNAIDGI
jgi:hypothetical protein